ncbi:hypothetical protein TNCV_4298981 [Trichonephila clavipes]|nr:hypothetical protein TNCV_4298981 [Trichonephila clavipes]
MSVKTIGKRRKHCWPLYLMLCKGRYKTWISSGEPLFNPSFTACKDAAILKKEIWTLSVMIWMGVPSQSLTTPFCVELRAKIDATYYQQNDLKHMIKETVNLAWKVKLVQTLSVVQNPVGNLDGSQILCAALRALALNSREQLIREQREDPELGHIYRYLENPDDGSVNATICEN